MERVLFYLVAVWESLRQEYRDSRLLLNAVRDGDNLTDLASCSREMLHYKKRSALGN
jgi:hypothetical protein